VRIFWLVAAAVYSRLTLHESPQTQGTGNLMPTIVEAVEANATVGEISDAMRRVYGEYHETVVI